jgi:uncharacterized membrane protein
MSFESSVSKARIATLLIILLPILSVGAQMPFYFLGISSSSIIILSVIFSALNFAGYLLFLISMNGLSKVYDDARIFKNSLYAFVTNVISAILISIIIYAYFIPIFGTLTSYPASSGATPPLSIFITILQGILVIGIGGSILAAINGFFFRQAFNALAEKSGEDNFKTAGLFMLLGGALTIILVGGLLFLIGWIIAAVGFFSLKNKIANPTIPYTQNTPTNPAMQKKNCPNCGTENLTDALYCANCGNKL